jgi:hypothetical protein
MTILPANLFTQFIQQGTQIGLISDITRTLDGEFYLHVQYLESSITNLVEKNGNIYIIQQPEIACTYCTLGKMTVAKLAEELCIEQFNVEKAVSKLSANNNWTVIDDLILTE